MEYDEIAKAFSEAYKIDKLKREAEEIGKIKTTELYGGVSAATTTSWHSEPEMKGFEELKIPTLELSRADMASVSKMFDIDWETSQLNTILSQLKIEEVKSDAFIIAGGALVRHLMKTNILEGDLDFFPCHEVGIKALKEHFEGLDFKLEKTKFSETYTGKIGARPVKVQIIRQSKTPIQTLKEFDFINSKLGYQSGSLRFHQATLVSLAQKKLKLGFIKDPSYSLKRAVKYKKIGFDTDEAMMKLAFMAAAGSKNVEADDFTEMKVDY